MTPRTRNAVWITLAVCAILIGTQFTVETDREQLQQLVTTMGEAVDDGDLFAMETCLSPDFAYLGRDKEKFLERLNVDLQRIQFDEVSVGGFDVEVTGDRATVDFRATADVKADNAMRPNVLTQWSIVCVRGEDGWQMQRIESGKVGIGPATIDIEDARGY